MGLSPVFFSDFFCSEEKSYDMTNKSVRCAFLDMTIVKFMFTAILVGTVGIYLLTDLGLAKLSVKSTILGGHYWRGIAFWYRLGTVGVLSRDRHRCHW